MSDFVYSPIEETMLLNEDTPKLTVPTRFPFLHHLRSTVGSTISVMQPGYHRLQEPIVDGVRTDTILVPIEIGGPQRVLCLPK